MPETLAHWAEWMSAGGMSDRTISERLRILASLSRAIDADLAACTWQMLSAWLSQQQIATTSRHVYLNALRAYYKWTVLTDLRADDPTLKLAKIRSRRGVPRPISTDQLTQALASGRFYSRTRTMILLAAYAGLRCAEIARMSGHDVRGDTLRIFGKGNTDILLPLHPILADEARRYPRIGWWFPSPTIKGAPITAKNVSTVVGKALTRAGVPATAHQIRHWYGTEALRASGGDLRLTQELMRHASPATTAIYTAVDDTQRRRVMNALPVPLHVPKSRAS